MAIILWFHHHRYHFRARVFTSGCCCWWHSVLFTIIMMVWHNEPAGPVYEVCRRRRVPSHRRRCVSTTSWKSGSGIINKFPSILLSQQTYQFPTGMMGWAPCRVGRKLLNGLFVAHCHYRVWCGGGGMANKMKLLTKLYFLRRCVVAHWCSWLWWSSVGWDWYQDVDIEGSIRFLGTVRWCWRALYNIYGEVPIFEEDMQFSIIT